MTFSSASNQISDQHGLKSDVQDGTLLLDRRWPGRLVPFLGLSFSPMEPETLFDRVVAVASLGRPFTYLITPNVDQIVRLSQDESLRPLFQDAWANVNDSRILEVLARQSGLTLPACPGSDLTAKLFERAISPDEPVVIIGGSRDVIDIVTQKYGLKDVRWYEPPMGLRHKHDAIAATAQFCADNPARFTFLCVGNPQQEMVAQAIARAGVATGMGLCVGASLEFLAGKRSRAPIWMQHARLEWLFRLLSEPKVLWRRYLIEGPKIFGIWLAWRKTDTTSA